MNLVLLLIFLTSLTNADKTKKAKERKNFWAENCPKVDPPPPSFEISKYMGIWKEIARSSNTYENELDCVKFTYSQPHGTDIKIENRGKNLKTGLWSSMTGEAFRTDQPNHLKLKFDDDKRGGEYYIVDTDFEDYSVVVGCRAKDGKALKFAWILSRKSHLSRKVYNKLVQKLEKFGISRKDLRITERARRKCTK